MVLMIRGRLRSSEVDSDMAACTLDLRAATSRTLASTLAVPPRLPRSAHAAAIAALVVAQVTLAAVRAVIESADGLGDGGDEASAGSVGPGAGVWGGPTDRSHGRLHAVHRLTNTNTTIR